MWRWSSVVCALLACACGRVAFDPLGGDGGGGNGSGGSGPGSCATSCGTGSVAGCCDRLPVPSGTFLRGYDPAADTRHKDMMSPATVSAFVLDRFEVTVARFRVFVAAGGGTQANPPAPGSGAHPTIAGSGWTQTDDARLPATTQELTTLLQCMPPYHSWTQVPGPDDARAINCVNWYVAAAFCIWDGGYLPTEAEWHFAASGGEEQRVYPWSSPPDSPTIDCSRGNFGEDFPEESCTTIGVDTVGTTTPNGDGRWGHSDLAGNVGEWTLDSNAVYTTPCVDCASLGGTSRVWRGGSGLSASELELRSAFRSGDFAFTRSAMIGIRCARPAN